MQFLYSRTSVRKGSLMLLLSIFFLTGLSAQSIVSQHGRLRVDGNEIVDKTGEPVSLAGSSLFWSNAGDVTDYYRKETVEILADQWNSSIVRAAIGVKEDGDGGRGYVDSPALQLGKATAVIDAAIANGVYVIVDWHTHEAEKYQAEAITFFREIARRYGNTDNLIYEVYNEPIDQNWPTVKRYAQAVTNAIRAIDPDNLIIVGSPFYSQRVDLAAADPLPDANTAYSLHFYSGTHGVNLRRQAKDALDAGIALLVTEWGSVLASGKGAPFKQNTEDWLDFMRENKLSHVSWAISDKVENDGSIGANMVDLGKGVFGLRSDQLTPSGVYAKEIIEDWSSAAGPTDPPSNTGVCRSVECIRSQMALATPGSEIVVAPGTYQVNDKIPSTFNFAYLFSDKNGSARNPITLRGQDPTNPPTIVGRENSSGYLLSIEGDYWVVKDMNFRTGAKGVVLDNSNNSKLINLNVSDVGEEAIHLRDGSSNNLVQRCTVTNTGRNKPGVGEGFYVGSDKSQQLETKGPKSKYLRACNNNVIEFCTSGPNVTAEGVDIKEGTLNTIVRNSTFIAKGIAGKDANSADAFIDAKGSEVFIYNNRFLADGEPNISSGVDFQDRGTDFNTGTKIAIYNNTFVLGSQSGKVSVARKKGGDPSAVHIWENKGVAEADKFPSDGTLNFVTRSCPNASWNTVIPCSGTPPPPPPPPTDACAGNGASIAGRIQAEDFCKQNGIRTQATSDVGGGQNVGYIDRGDYLDYRLSVPSSGRYTLAYRVASRFASGEVQFRSGSRVLATTAIPNTGDWQNWRTITTTVDLSAGNQTLRLFASGPNWNINWFTLTTASTPPPPPTGGSCTFGAPSGSALPALDALTFSEVYILGNGGPALRNFKKFSINYSAQYADVYQFAINTNDGNPGFYVDLKSALTYRFNLPQPDLSLSGTGITGLDGSYWIVKDGANVALVDKTRGFTLYFSNSATAPACGAGAGARISTVFREETPGVFPNPTSDVLYVTGLSASAGTYHIIDVRGAIVRQASFAAGERLSIGVTDLATGAYLLRVEQREGTLTERFVRQ
ncbi:cellulase family glycosylhydrolase [Neolewinella antarctica]|uniref:Endoglucanase n=1 Tax=Neolewinella antarctica TaxID=442734 RepID=A0ABX0X9Q0_9BACT|nr:cellulase family glycosylhydrolase [Neolewinella antarctica]NJC25962.1 endoglucanase [Neolewinella antarctica]